MEKSNRTEQKKAKIKLEIDHIKFQRDDWGIVGARPIEEEDIDKYGSMITIKGLLPLNIDKGEVYNTILQEDFHPKYGKGYNIIGMGMSVSSDDKSSYLKHILTELQYENAMKIYNDDKLYELLRDNKIDELAKIKGIGKTTAKKLVEDFTSKLDNSQVYAELKPYGMTDNLIKKLLSYYNNNGILLMQKFKNNPYHLLGRISNVGFATIDNTAKQMGISNDDPRRLIGFTIWFLEKKALEGDSYISLVNEYVPEVISNIGNVKPNVLIETLSKDKRIIITKDKKFIYLRKYLMLENDIKNEIIRLRDSTPIELEYGDWETKLKEIEQEQGYEFTEEQRNGIIKTMNNNVTVITGLGGTGKSSIVKAIYKLANISEDDYSQCALSGRASARLFDITGVEGKTIHRLLGYRGGEFVIGKKELKEKIIVLDEASMVNAGLFLRLIESIQDGAKLIIMGDIGQLEPIGGGNILHDLIDSGEINVVNLTKIHRQAKESAIITASRAFRVGKNIVPRDFRGTRTLGKLQDLDLTVVEESEGLVNMMVKQFLEVYKQTKDLSQIQIITPLNNRSDLCNYNINKIIQDLINPRKSNKSEINVSNLVNKSKKDFILRENDKIMCIRNNYKTEISKSDLLGKELMKDDLSKMTNKELDEDFEKEEIAIYNGSFGKIVYIDNRHIYLRLDNIGLVRLANNSELKNYIALGYSASVHKMQGDERQYIIVGIDNASYVMQSREMLYTAITRAKKKCFLFVQSSALRNCCRTTKVKRKKTFLPMLLKNNHKK